MATGITFQPKKTINITPIILILIGIAVVIFTILVICDSVKNKKKDNTENKKMYCKKCGTKIDDDSVFCYMCGTNVTLQLESQELEMSKEAPKKPQEQQFKKEDLEGMGYKPILVIIAIILGVFSLLTVLLLNLE